MGKTKKRASRGMEIYPISLAAELFAEWQAAPCVGGKGYTLQQQADLIGVSPGTLRKIYERMGFETRKRKIR